MRGKWLLVGGVVALLVLGAGAVSLLRRQGSKSSVATSRAAASTFSGPVVSLPGRIEAVEAVTVPVPFPGRINSMPVAVGSEVAEGELLAEIRSSDLGSQSQAIDNELNRLRTRVSTLESTLLAARLEASRARESAGAARASMEDAQKLLLRQQMLFDKGAASRQAVDRAQSVFEGAAQLNEAQQKLVKLADDRVAKLARDLDEQQQALTEKSKEAEDLSTQTAMGDVRSPVDGVVIARKGQVGDEVSMDVQDLFQIAVNLSLLRVVVDAPAAMLEKVRVGQEAVLQIAEAPEGIVTKVTEVRAGQVIVEFARPNAEVKPGLTVQVVIKLT